MVENNQIFNFGEVGREVSKFCSIRIRIRVQCQVLTRTRPLLWCITASMNKKH